MNPHKCILAKLIDVAGIWLISGILLYGMLPDTDKNNRGFWTSLIISFLLSVYIALQINSREHAPLSRKPVGNTNRHNLVSNIIANWILFSLIYYSLLSDGQKAHEIWGCILYGSLIAIGFVSGKLALVQKSKQIDPSLKNED